MIGTFVTGSLLLAGLLVGRPARAKGDAGRDQAETSNRAPAEIDRGKPLTYESHGVRLTIETSDLTLARVGEPRPFFSYRQVQQQRFATELATLGKGEAPDGGQPQCTRRIEVKVVTWTGALLGLRETAETTCAREAHPSGESRFVLFAIDAAGKDPLRSVSLKDWVAERPLFEALRKDALVRRAITGAEEKPTDTAGLVEALAASPPVVDGDRACYAFPDDLLQRFVPSHLEGGKLAVRLSLPGAAVCRTRLTEVGILVPPPRALSSALSSAAAGRDGFLKRNVPPQLAGRPLAIELTSGH